MSVDLIILAGFLGSGKTSLLVDYLQKNDASDTGVIVNEVGEIGIDGAIVADTADDLSMTMLANGCVCCSLRSGLVHTISALLDAPRSPALPPIKRIILETSGVSRPGPIVASLSDPELLSRGVKASVVTTYDCQAGTLNIDESDEAVAQFAAAQRVVLTKVDCVSPDSLLQHQQVIKDINPLAEIVALTDRAQAVEAAFQGGIAADPIEVALKGIRASGHQRSEHSRIHVMSGAPAQDVMSWEDVALWCDELSALCGSRLLRLKALVRITDCAEPILIQSVGTTFSAPRRLMKVQPDDTACVVITRDIDAAEINGALLNSPIVLSPVSTS